MESYIGKHLLVDCYRCKEGVIDAADLLIPLMGKVADKLDTDLYGTFYHESDHEIIVAGFGNNMHIDIHAYPIENYTAVDIYLYDTETNPTSAMRILRDYLQPDKIRATSVKRGNIDRKLDLKPKIKSNSTTIRKMRHTTQQLNDAGQKVVGLMKPKKVVGLLKKGKEKLLEREEED